MVNFQPFLPVIGGAFVDWLKLFIAPLENLDMLWIVVPIWGTWIFSEFFQEKKGTNFGNAITNGAVMLFVGIDWIRYIIRQINAGNSSLSIDTITELGISVVIICTSLSIIILGIKGNKIVKYVGRVRESTYVLLMFTPIIYGVVDFNFRNIAVVVTFFPVFYLIVEIIDRLLPTPKVFELEEEEKLWKETEVGKKTGIADFNASNIRSDFGPEMFGSNRQGVGGQLSQLSQFNFPQPPPPPQPLRPQQPIQRIPPPFPQPPPRPPQQPQQPWRVPNQNQRS